MTTTKAGNRKHSGSAILKAYKTHYHSLKKFVTKLLKSYSHHDVEDIIQEAFLLAYRAENLKSIDQPRAFLFRVAKNVTFNIIRQKSRRSLDYLQNCEASAFLTTASLEDEFVAQETLELHCAAIATLPPQCRKIYLMRKVYAMSYKEIAEALGITVSTVESHLEKGFARCQAYVEERRGNNKFQQRLP